MDNDGKDVYGREREERDGEAALLSRYGSGNEAPTDSTCTG